MDDLDTTKTGRRWRLCCIALAMALGACLGALPAANADPPPWAPAHGYRYHHNHYHRHAYRHEDEDDRDDSGDRGYYPPWRSRTAVGAQSYIANGTCNREAVGRLVGSVVGGIAGSQIGKGKGRTAATVVGAIVGFVVGGNIGRSMDQADQTCVGQTLEYTPDHRPVAWHNPDTGTNYTVTPTRTYQSDGQYCREYTQKALIGGRTHTVYGTACRQADGSWKIQH